VDERWLVPHFEKMSYDNSELLKLRARLAGHWNPILREVAEGIIGWVDQTLSDQHMAVSMPARMPIIRSTMTATISPGARRVARRAFTRRGTRAELRFDVEAHGEMHHNAAKNVLWIRRSPQKSLIRLDAARRTSACCLQARRASCWSARQAHDPHH